MLPILLAPALSSPAPVSNFMNFNDAFTQLSAKKLSEDLLAPVTAYIGAESLKKGANYKSDDGENEQKCERSRLGYLW